MLLLYDYAYCRSKKFGISRRYFKLKISIEASETKAKRLGRVGGERPFF